MSSWEVKGLCVADGQGFSLAQETVILSSRCSKEVAWDLVELSFEYIPSDENIIIEIDPWYFVLDHRNGRVILSRYIAANYMRACDVDFETGKNVSVKIVCTTTHAEIYVNDRRVTCESAEAVRMVFAYLHFPKNTRFSQPTLHPHFIREPHQEQLLSVHDMQIEFTVDFYDDLITTDFDRKKMDGMFKSMAELGAKRAYWIDHGRRDSGLWEYGPIAMQVKNALKSFDQLNGDFLPPAVEAAKRNGMELIGVFKPFDTAIMHSTASFASNEGLGEALGGRMTHAFRFPAEHPELCMKRRNIPPKPSGIGRVEITSRQELSESLVKDIELWISDDNSSYEQYAGTVNCTLKGKTIILDSLDISSKFMAIKFPENLATSVSNTLPKLAKVYDLAGNEIEFTYGLVPRKKHKQRFHLDREIEVLDFRDNGMCFDNVGAGIPNALWNHERVNLEIFSPRTNMNTLGLTAGVNPVVPGVLSESEPGTHEFWLDWTRHMLDAGVDGVEMRMMNHGDIINWGKYGFNLPLVEEYRKRWGVDITVDDYDAEKFQKLRGEFFTEFLRKASSITRSRGKKFYIHIEDMYCGPAEEPCFMSIHLPLRQWIEDKLCDAVTLKVLNVKGHMTAFARDVIALSHKNGIPVTYTPFFHSIASDDKQIWDYVKVLPFKAFNVYEYATIFITQPDGNIEPVSGDYVEYVKSISMTPKQFDNVSLDLVDVQTSDFAGYDESLRRWQGIPGICWAGGDRLLATWYSGGLTEGPENYVVVVKSDDAGKTWSQPVAVVAPHRNVRAFDPTIWQDPQGRVWLFWAQGWSPADEKIWDGRAGVWCSVCDEPLATDLRWSQPKRICDGIMMNKPFIARDGRWLLPVSIWNIEPYHPETDGKRLAGLVVSDDLGKTFTYVGGAKILENVFDEHVIFDRKNGDLVLWSRTLNGMAESISSDGGKTWCNAYKNGMDCPNSRFSIARTHDAKFMLVNHDNPRMDEYSVCRGRKSSFGRNNLTVLLSEDDGQTWTTKSMLDKRQGVSYPDIDVNADGRIAVIYDYDRFGLGNILTMIFTEKNVYENELPSPVVVSKLQPYDDWLRIQPYS